MDLELKGHRSHDSMNKIRSKISMSKGILVMIYESPALQGIAGSSSHVYLVYQVDNEKSLGSRIIFTTD